jgi:hypothetical protein
VGYLMNVSKPTPSLHKAILTIFEPKLVPFEFIALLHLISYWICMVWDLTSLSTIDEDISLTAASGRIDCSKKAV